MRNRRRDYLAENDISEVQENIESPQRQNGRTGCVTFCYDPDGEI